jgi:hypothetical protein
MDPAPRGTDAETCLPEVFCVLAPACWIRRCRPRRCRVGRLDGRYVARGGAARCAWPQGDLDRGRQDRVRDGAKQTQQRVVHASTGADQRGVLPRPLHAQRSQPGAGRHRRLLHRPRVDGHATPNHPAGCPQPQVPAGQRGQGGRYKIVETFVTDPRRAAMDVNIRFISLDGGSYRLYALYDPSLANSGMDDSGGTQGHALVATDGSANVASALVAQPRFGATSTGYLGTSDGWTDRPSRRPAARPRLRPRRTGQHRPDRPDHRRDRSRRTSSGDAEPGLREHAGRGPEHHRRLQRNPVQHDPDALRPRLARMARDAPAGAGQRPRHPPSVPGLGAGRGGSRGQAAPGRFRRLPDRTVGMGR